MNNRFISVVAKVAGILYAALFGLVIIGVGFAGMSESATVGWGMTLVMLLFYGPIGFCVLALLWGYGNILRDVDEIKDANKRLLEQNHKLMQALNISEGAYDLSAISEKINVEDGKWECPNCQQLNPSSSRMCSGCGMQR